MSRKWPPFIASSPCPRRSVSSQPTCQPGPRYLAHRRVTNIGTFSGARPIARRGMVRPTAMMYRRQDRITRSE